MKPLCEFSDIYLYRKSIDFRKQINGLSVLVLEELNVSLCDNSLFVFTNMPKLKANDIDQLMPYQKLD